MSTECPLCGGAWRPWIVMPVDAKKETPIVHRNLLRCERCSFGQIQPRPGTGDLAEFYDLPNYYTHGQSHFADGGPSTFFDRIRNHLAWRLDFGEPLTADFVQARLGKKSASICDIGCGTGELAAELGRRGFDVVGVEIDGAAADLAERNGVVVARGSIEALPDSVASQRFDAVILSHVLEHVLDPVGAVSTVRGLLRPGGEFICEVPNNASAGLRYSGPAWEPLDVPRHVNFFVPANLEEICRRAGLEPVRLFFSGYCRQFHNDWIATEARVFDAIARQANRAEPAMHRNSKWRAWRLLARTAFAARATKYDSVGIVARINSSSY